MTLQQIWIISIDNGNVTQAIVIFSTYGTTWKLFEYTSELFFTQMQTKVDSHIRISIDNIVKKILFCIVSFRSVTVFSSSTCLKLTLHNSYKK